MTARNQFESLIRGEPQPKEKPADEWELIELPVGPQPFPRWAKGLAIYWAEGYSNPPSFTLKTDTALRDWPNKRYRKDGDRYMAQSEDGRAEVYWHNGSVCMRTLQRWVRGTPQWDTETNTRKSTPGHHEEYQALATTQQEGFGGSHYECPMYWPPEYRGQTITLRGPWSAGGPPGYIDVAYVDLSAKWRGGRDRRHWDKQTAMAGLYIREEVFINIFARFLPHLRLARVTCRGFTNLEPLKPEWNEPKHWVMEADRQIRIARAA